MSERMRQRVAKLEARTVQGGRPVFVHSYQEPVTQEEVEANRRAEVEASAARLEGRAVVRFVHVAAPAGERAALAGD